MDDRKHKIYFAIGIDEDRNLFYKYGQTIETLDQRFNKYFSKTKRMLYPLFCYELQIPEDPEDRWAQADIAENALAKVLRFSLGYGFTLIGERFYPNRNSSKKGKDNGLRIDAVHRFAITRLLEEKLQENNIKFTKGEVW